LVVSIDLGAELARIEADYQRRRDEAEAEYQADLKALREVRQAYEEDPERWFRDQSIYSLFGGTLMTEDDLAARRDRGVREADKERLRRLQALEQMRGLVKAARSTGGAPDKDYDGLAVAKVVRELKLAGRNGQEPPSPAALSKRSNGALSDNAAKRIERLTAAGVLDWNFDRDQLGIGGQFRTTPEKISLRALERAAGLEPLT
jgi:hypothetical protein